MEYQKIINWLENTPNQSNKFRKRKLGWNKWWLRWNVHQTKFKASMLRTSLYDYSNIYILESGAITITGAGNDDSVRRLDERNSGVIFKSFAPPTDCISETNNTRIDNAKYVGIHQTYIYAYI